MTEQPLTQLVLGSVQGLPDTLNAYRAEHDRPPLVRSRILNFNAFDRAHHLVEAGMRDGSYLEDTVRPLEEHDLTVAVELVRQWPTIKDPAKYLTPWIKDELAHSVLLGDYGFVGIGAAAVPLEGSSMRAVVVMVMTQNQPRRP